MRFPGAILFISVMLVTGSCVDIPKYDHAPRIEFVGIDLFDVRDSLSTTPQVRITLSFEDGDGDLGEDAQSKVREAFLKENGGWGNYHVQILRFVNGEWLDYNLSELDYLIFPILKTDGVRGPIRGKLDYDIPFSYGSGNRPTPLKFIVKIRDRELRESNVIETDSISVPIFVDDF